MHVLPEAFTLATSIGLWEPRHWMSSSAKRLYRLYTCFTFSMLVLLMLSQFIATLFFTKSVDDFTEATYILLSTINACVKGATILLRRRRVIDLVDMLKEKECIPRNVDETKLCSYFQKMSRYTVISCAILGEATVTLIALWPMIFYRGESLLPLRSWQPYNVESGTSYCLSYLHQWIALMLVAAYDAANDTLITGFMVQACAQLELMTFRLRQLSSEVSASVTKKVPKDTMRVLEKKIVIQCVKHHLLIFRFTDYINSTFVPVILVQFCLSSIVLCVTVYQMSANKSNRIEVLNLVVYLLSLLVEFFIYCWFGNEVTLKSIGFSAAICEMDWTALHVKTLNEVLIMMVRSTSPILMSCGPLITLSLESFTTMIKISYSFFNVLQRSN